ncbi:MAG TPA: hypothetical protein VF528_17850 [Pyrinomonadaceae bacterium]|jgi:hypothetical protein
MQSNNFVGAIYKVVGRFYSAVEPFDTNSEVRIEFNKRGYDGVLIESQRAGELQWVLLGYDAYSPYIDSRPPLTPDMAEVREYRVRYIKRDEPVGEWSDIISVSTMP